MKGVELNKLECSYPAFFKVMWLAMVVWLAVCVANYFGHWLLPDKLDGFGMSVLFLLVVAIIRCFGKGLLDLISKHDMLVGIIVTKKVASYGFVASFVALLIVSIWEICSTTGGHSDFLRTGTIPTISLEAVFSIVCDMIKAALFSIVLVVLYWYGRTCFVLFYGRIRRLGIEIAIALLLLVYLFVNKNDQLWLNAVIVLIASSFLYDIWHLADFQKDELPTNWINKLAEEE